MGIVRDTKSSRKIPSGMLYILFSFTPWVVYWVFPGGGIEAVVISGILCANDICGWNRRECKDENGNRKNKGKKSI